MKRAAETKSRQTLLGTPDNWQLKRWGDLATLEYGKSLGGHQDSSGQFPVFGTNGQIGWSNQYLHPSEGIIIGRKGAYRGIHYSPKPFFVIDTAFFLKPLVEFSVKWAYYELLTQDMNAIDSGSAIPSTTRSDFYNLDVRVPPLPEQESIARILSDLDSRIEINQRINKAVEAMGKAIFKHWFIDFEFPNEQGKPYKSSGGEMVYNEELDKEIPREWATKPIDEIADFLNGLALQNFPPETEEQYLPAIKIRELRQGTTESSDRASPNIPKEYIVDDGDVLFSWSGTLEVVLWTSGRGALNQHLFKVTSAKFPKWFCYYWILEHLPEYRRIAEGKATTMGHIQRYHLTDSLVLVPDQATLRRMDKIQRPIINKLVQAGVESRTLSEVRDALLPKLMSGKVRVPVEVR